jgi:hypothetical protein
MLGTREGRKQRSFTAITFDSREDFRSINPIFGGMFFMLAIYNSPEINTWSALVEISLINAPNSAFGEEDSNERGIVAARPIFDGEYKRVRVMLWWIGKLEKAVERDLKRRNNEQTSRFF